MVSQGLVLGLVLQNGQWDQGWWWHWALWCTQHCREGILDRLEKRDPANLMKPQQGQVICPLQILSWLISSGLCSLWGCGRSSFSTCARGTNVWIGWGQSYFGSYLGVKVKAADVSSSHLSAAGLLLKAHSWSQMLNGCQGQLVILNIWNYGRTALQACSCSFSFHKTWEVSQQWKPLPLSLVGSIHSLLSQYARAEVLSIFFEDELKHRLPIQNVL